MYPSIQQMARVGTAIGKIILGPQPVRTGKGTPSGKAKRRAANKAASASRKANRK